MKELILATMAFCFFTATNAKAQKTGAGCFLFVVTATIKTEG
jgi:hypothetical protein